MDSHCAYLYIMASKQRGALYVGVTSNLGERIRQHKAYRFDDFTRQYNITHLVYVERHTSFDAASLREQHIKRLRRPSKLELVERVNPRWEDLTERASRQWRESSENSEVSAPDEASAFGDLALVQS